MKEVREQQQQQGLYRSEFEHDNCGIGAVVNIKGKKTHDTVANALKIVEHLEHRAGKDAEGKTGDGVGILLQISHKFFKKACKKEGFEIGDEREYGIAQFFFPQHEIKRAQAKKMFEIILEKEGLELLGWRQVPVFPEVLGHKARECMPCIMQAFIKKPEDVEKGLPFDRMLYIARREFEQSNDNTYVTKVCSWLDSFVLSSKIFRTRIMNLQSPWYIPVSVPTQTQAGREHILTALWYTTVRSTPSAATQIRCLQEKKIWNHHIWRDSFIKCSLL